MTGYGRASATFADMEITAELRAVNNRYLDCTVKLPRLYSYAEDRLVRAVKAAVARGKVEVFFTVRRSGGESAVALNRPVAEGYLRAMRETLPGCGQRRPGRQEPPYRCRPQGRCRGQPPHMRSQCIPPARLRR